MELAGKRVLVVGLGASGQAAARLCLAQEALVRATDQAAAPAGAQDLAGLGAELSLGGHRASDFTWAQVVVLSPGVDQRRPEVAAAARAGAEVIGELELGWRFLKRPCLMITGTNGKSTVTTLVGRMLEQAGQRVFLGGNLGQPLCQAVLGPQQFDWAVLEVSSFQTDSGPGLRPQVGVLLNISPDHLDRYRDFDQYAASKLGIFARQGPDQVAVLCADDPEVDARRGLASGRLWLYGAAGPHRPGGWLEDEDLLLAPDQGPQLRLSAAASRLAGGFNRLNLLAASLASLAAGAPAEALQAVIDQFPGLPHRLQWVGQAAGVDYYDDSKGTNVGAVVAAMEALQRSVVLLLGGRDKQGRFDKLAPSLRRFARLVICFGEAGPAISRQLGQTAPAQVVADLAQAVSLAATQAAPGEAVLLSPGCASFDAYQSYAQRGEHFQALVKEVAGG